MSASKFILFLKNKKTLLPSSLALIETLSFSFLPKKRENVMQKHNVTATTNKNTKQDPDIERQSIKN